MSRKKRGYKRDTPVELQRDYKLFVIACEGSKREPAYFNLFNNISERFIVDVIAEIISDDEMAINHPLKSAPKWVLDRAMMYIEKEGLSDEDDLWFVMDTDDWQVEQLIEIVAYCNDNPNWHIVLSNPCFEVWLYFHKKKDISISTSNSAHDFKYEISTFEKGGYHPLKFISNFENAIENAKNADSNTLHFFPNKKETKVYQLGEKMLTYIGENAFHEFLRNILPKLIQAEIERVKKYKKPK